MCCCKVSMMRRLMAHFEVTSDEVRVPANNFHAIRYVLALFVLYSHSFGLLVLPEPGLFAFTFGSLAVKCFFALSGYLIALSCMRTNNLIYFAWNRILRIVPALVIAMIGSHYVGKYFDFFITNPVPYIVNGPVWTLSWEVLCYGLCGLLWWLGLLTISSLGAIVVVSWILFIIMPTTSETAIIIAPLLLLFFSGAYIALNKKHFNLNVAGPVFFALLVFVCFDSNAIGLSWLINQVPFLYGPAFTAQRYQLLIFLFSLPFVLLWLAYCKPVIPIRNDYSYGLYILGWPVQQVVVATTHPSPLVLFIMSWAITHCLAMLSWHIIEKRALMFKR